MSPSTLPPSTVRHTEASPQSTPSQPRHALGVLWKPGYNDRILLQEGQLQRMLNYLDDTPRRLLLKQAHSQYFKPLGKLTIAGIDMEAMGNTALLGKPIKLQVQCSRHLYPNEIEERKQHFLTAARQGAEGRLLMLSPYPWQNEKIENMRQRCLQLNDIAAEICKS